MKRKSETTAAEAVAKAQAKVLEAGGERLTLTLGPDDAEAWRRLVRRYGNARGAKMQAFRDAVANALNNERGGMSKAELLAELERRLR